MQKDNPNPTLRIGIRVLIILIILAILFILSLGIIKLVPKALDGISSLRSSTSTSSSSNNNESLTVISDRTTVSPNDTVNISWKHINQKQSDGYYAFKYACQSAVVFQTLTSTSITCGTEYIIPTTSINTTLTGVKSIMLKVVSEGNFIGTSSVAFSIDYINPATKTSYISGLTNFMFVNNTDGIATTTPTTVTSRPIETAPVYVAPSVPRQPDLQVKILSVGVLTANNQFIAQSQVNQGERAAIQFQITNIGGRATPNWIFQAHLPSANATEANYISPLQGSLQSGGSVLYTLGFDGAGYGSQVVSVTADPNNTISEISKTNNTATTNIFVNGNNYGTTGTNADLAISGTQVGYIGYNGQFVQASSIPYGSTAAVQLVVINNGGNASGNWSFTGNINANNTYNSGNYYGNNGNVYNSGTLSSLSAGGTQTFTIQLSQLSRGTTSLNITLDPNNQSQDTNRNNNYSTVQLYVY